MKTLESIFSRTAQFGLLIYLTGCFGLLIVLGAAVAKWLKLIDVIQYIAFAFGLGLLTLLIAWWVSHSSALGVLKNFSGMTPSH